MPIPVGWKPVTSAGGLLASSVAKAVRVLRRAGHWEPQSLLLCGWYCQRRFFFLAPSHLHTSQLCQFLGGVKSRSVLCVVYWNLVTHPTLPFLARGTLSRWGAVPAWGMGWCRQNETIVPSLFLWLFSGFFALLYCWSFLRGLQSSPKLFLFLDSCLIIDLFEGCWLGSSTLPSCWLTSLPQAFWRKVSYVIPGPVT